MNNQSVLDFSQAKINRDNGITVSELNANSVWKNWSDDATIILKHFIDYCPGEFQAEEVRKYATRFFNLPEPPSARAWGGVIFRAAKAGIIKRVGIAPTSNPSAHCANASVWVKA